jgi:hypothetical protein
LRAKNFFQRDEMAGNTFDPRAANLLSRNRCAIHPHSFSSDERGFSRRTRFLKGGIYASYRASSRLLFCDGRARTIAEQAVSACEVVLRTNDQRFRPAEVRCRIAAKTGASFRETRPRDEARSSNAAAPSGHAQAFQVDHDIARQKAAQASITNPEVILMIEHT